MTDRSLFKRLFLCALAPQLLLCAAYWIFGLDLSGGETQFQRVLMQVYAPATYLAFLPALFAGWAGVGFFLIFFPLIGALLYSLAFAAVGHSAKTGALRAFFGLFRGGA